MRPGALNKPHYVFRPRQLLHRRQRPSTVVLPWGLSLRIDPADAIGSSIARTGIYDLLVTELLHRLTDPGATTIDVGANIGYMSSILAARAGPEGRVLALEPHPAVFDRLNDNVERWRRAGVRNVLPLELAASDRSGNGELITPAGFNRNAGLGTVADPGTGARSQPTLPIELARLDDLVELGHPEIIKIDVEGHEPEALRGSEGLLRSGAVRDILFEAGGPYPSPATDILESSGYRILTPVQHLLGPRILSPGRPVRPSWSPPSHLATLDPARALRRLAPLGWRSLRNRSRRQAQGRPVPPGIRPPASGGGVGEAVQQGDTAL
jgi:FkbM family methyltransferase